MNDYLSKKITFFHVFGILLVLPIHTYFPCTETFGFVKHLFILLCRSFQPIYFGIAGYLFFINISGGGYKDKLLKRTRTLLIPYLIWNIWNTILMVAFDHLGIDAPIMSKYRMLFENISFLNCMKYIFWVPAAGHLWFIRDLMLASLLSWPLLILLRNKKWFTLVILGCIALVTTQCQTASLFSFAVGGYLSINKVDIQNIRKGIIVIAGILCVAMLVLFTYTRKECNAIPVLSWGTAVLFWVLYDKTIPTGQAFNMTPWRSYFFFIYLFHDPWLNIMCTYVPRLLPNTFLMNIFVFIAAQASIIVVTLLFAGFLNNHFPKCYNIITGKR